MRKRALLAIAALSILATGCKKGSNYVKYDNENFQIEYPESWETMENPDRACLFAAYSPNLTQMVAIRTRSLDSIPEEERSLEQFAESRIKAFEQEIIDFNLQQVETVDDGIILHYSSGKKDSEQSVYIEEKMKLSMKGNTFYGVNISASNETEKDTADYIVRSFCMK